MMIEVLVDRSWFFTWRTYGSWLPGADGFVGYYRNPDRVIDNSPDQSVAESIPALERYARSQMKGREVLLTKPLAEVLLRQFQESAAYRGWRLDAAAVMTNHVHLVFGVPGDPESSEVLKTWKSYASRALTRAVENRDAPRWFADSGSTRPLKTEASRVGAICYVHQQIAPLLLWLSPESISVLPPPAGEPAT